MISPLEEWKRLQEKSFLHRAVQEDQEESYWSKYARNYDLRVRGAAAQGRNSTVECVMDLLSPGMTVLEIGAGTGLYTTALVEKAEKVTVVEPSPSMLQVLTGKVPDKIGDNTVHILRQRWEEAEPDAHDVVLAAGCLYVFHDVRKAVERMLDKAKKLLILVSGKELNVSEIYREAASALGTAAPSSGPDYVHLYNVLCSMGIYANIRIHKQRRHPIYDDFDHLVHVFAERLELPSSKIHLLRDYLEKRHSVLPSGKLSLGNFDGLSAVICYSTIKFFEPFSGSV